MWSVVVLGVQLLAREPDVHPAGCLPVAVGCVGELPARPANTFGTGAYPGDKAAAQAALVDSAAWEGYATKLEVVVAGCR
jgi:hypothetical protein